MTVFPLLLVTLLANCGIRPQFKAVDIEDKKMQPDFEAAAYSRMPRIVTESSAGAGARITAKKRPTDLGIKNSFSSVWPIPILKPKRWIN